MTGAFRNLKYYFPPDTLPTVYSNISGLYYEAPIEYFGNDMIISLDLFLGRDFEPYRAIGLPQYTVRRMAPEYIVPESMKQVGMSHLPADLAPRTLLDHMILHGKVLFFLDAVLPSYNDTLKTGYTLAQEAWCKDNEASFWSLLLEDELLFSTDPFVVNKFILDGPFTSGLPKESPAMLGRWTGWQIVRKYMATHPDTGLGGLFAIEDSQRILSESRYKPSRR